MSDGNWNNLPSVVLLQIFKKLSQSERISASSTCREWRRALYCSHFWRTLAIVFSNNQTEKTTFIVHSFINILKNVSIIINDNPNYKLLSEAFELLNTNNVVDQVQIVGHREDSVCPDDARYILPSFYKFLSDLENIKLLHIESSWLLSDDCNAIINVLNRNTKTISHLGIGCSDKLQAFNSTECNMNSINFLSFTNLKVLKLHASWVSDELVHDLAANNCCLKRFVIEIGKQVPENNVGLDTWMYFKQMLPDCQLRINIIESPPNSLEYLNPVMPITHIKLLYCDSETISNILNLTRFVSLQSLWFIIPQGSCSHELLLAEDPFVFLAWKCPLLTELVLMGAKLDNDNLVGISRLRGSALKSLQVCTSDIVRCFSNKKEWSRPLLNSELKVLNTKISKALQRPWTPVTGAPYEHPSMDEKLKFIYDILSRDFIDD